MRRLILSPLRLLYAIALHIRHALYDHGLLKSTTPALPTIVIGNLSLGGTGKTPHVELVLRSLQGLGPLATLSRGYGRAGTGFREVQRADDAQQTGDEPLMMKRKFPETRVFVGVDRVTGCATIAQEAPGTRVIVLDDAFQHRALNGSLNILLTTWQRPWHTDALLPAGTLRDLPSRRRSAQMVVVTKCPALPDTGQQETWREQLGLTKGQSLFFSGYRYAPPRSLHDATAVVPTGVGTAALLVTGIADPEPLLAHAKSLFGKVEHMRFADHHAFNAADQRRIAERFVSFAGFQKPGEHKVLITTEKDAARLGSALINGPLEDIPIAVISIEAVILNDPGAFAELLRTHVATHPAHR